MTATLPFALWQLGCVINETSSQPESVVETAVANIDYLYAVDVAPDMDGDGASTLVAYQDGGEELAGILELWHRQPVDSVGFDVRVEASRDEFIRFARTWGTGPDATGDGISDVLVSAEGWNGEYLAYLASGQLLDEGVISPAEVAAATLTGFNLGGEDLSRTSRRPVGDFDGDGVGDLALIDYGGGLVLLLGPVTGARDVSDADGRSYPLDPNSLLAGDLDGDGYSDLVVHPELDGGPTRIFLGPTIPEDSEDAPATIQTSITTCGTSDEQLGFAATLANLDGDPSQELVLAGPYRDGRDGCAPLQTDALYLWLDPPSGHLDEGSAALRVDGTRGAGFGQKLVGADLDGDGSDELAVLSLTTLYVFADLSGRPAEADADARFDLGEVDPWDLGLAAGDLDGDGTPDLVVSGPEERAWVLAGTVLLP